MSPLFYFIYFIFLPFGTFICFKTFCLVKQVLLGRLRDVMAKEVAFDIEIQTPLAQLRSSSNESY